MVPSQENPGPQSPNYSTPRTRIHSLGSLGSTALLLTLPHHSHLRRWVGKTRTRRLPCHGRNRVLSIQVGIRHTLVRIVLVVMEVKVELFRARIRTQVVRMIMENAVFLVHRSTMVVEMYMLPPRMTTPLELQRLIRRMEQMMILLWVVLAVPQGEIGGKDLCITEPSPLEKYMLASLGWGFHATLE
ncbi:hypothetical protein AMTR_s00062p00204660 [Amborella trichopoda]|uniref:Uncharacterized protein n=1 Tax=Amborella trichopoda TaxID=13333 RepID=U5DH04_AMBTC|nr:hypothetical protein AMTR_s00062p00204660 [Amborella trichopoda]